MKGKTKDKTAVKQWKETYEEIRGEILLSAKLNRLYAEKKSSELVAMKVGNQMNSLEASIQKINPRYIEKPKYYEKIRSEILKNMDQYEEVLKQLCDRYDKKLEDFILQKVQLESKLLVAVLKKEYLYEKLQEDSRKGIVHEIGAAFQKIKNRLKKNEPLDVSMVQQLEDKKDVQSEMQIEDSQSEEYRQNRRYIVKLEKEIRFLKGQIKTKSEEKEAAILAAMESGGKGLVTEIRKPRTIQKITRFFANKFNSYHVIMKKVLEPMAQKIDEFKVNSLQKVDGKSQEFYFAEFEAKIEKMQKNILEDVENKWIRKKLEA